MSLWTPGGEHEVPREPTSSTHQPPDEPPESVEDLPGFDELTPEQQQQARAMAAELAEARRRLAGTPAAEIVANHVMGMYELAAIHLSTEPPATDEAKVAIDAMAAVVNSLTGRLGDNEPVLRQALQQIQLTFVQLTGE
jgi:hypothetical protein